MRVRGKETTRQKFTNLIYEHKHITIAHKIKYKFNLNVYLPHLVSFAANM